MECYINKDALLAEIERLYNLEYDDTSNLSIGKKIILRHIASFLSTIVVKDMDLLEEFERFYNELPYFDKQKFIGRHLDDARMEDIDNFISNFG